MPLCSKAEVYCVFRPMLQMRKLRLTARGSNNSWVWKIWMIPEPQALLQHTASVSTPKDANHLPDSQVATGSTADSGIRTLGKINLERINSFTLIGIKGDYNLWTTDFSTMSAFLFLPPSQRKYIILNSWLLPSYGPKTLHGIEEPCVLLLVQLLLPPSPGPPDTPPLWPSKPWFFAFQIYRICQISHFMLNSGPPMCHWGHMWQTSYFPCKGNLVSQSTSHCLNRTRFPSWPEDIEGSQGG